MIRKAVVITFIAMAILVAVTRFAVPVGANRRYSWRLADSGLHLSFGDLSIGPTIGAGAGAIAERAVRIDVDMGMFETTGLGRVTVTQVVGPWHGFDVHFIDTWFSKWLIVQTPASFLFCVLLVYPVVALIRSPARRRRRRRREGLCLRCGYDLKGNVSGTCPECGETP